MLYRSIARDHPCPKELRLEGYVYTAEETKTKSAAANSEPGSTVLGLCYGAKNSSVEVSTQAGAQALKPDVAVRVSQSMSSSPSENVYTAVFTPQCKPESVDSGSETLCPSF